MKAEDNKNLLVPDPYASRVVCDIFRMRLEGASASKIASELNRLGILSPLAYKKNNGLPYAASVHLSETAFWILYIAWTQGDGCTQKEICDSWSYSRQTINTALKNLERQGILCLKTAEGNRKNKRIYFSREGKAFADRVVAPFVRAELLSLERLGDREREQLTRLNERRTEYFRQELEEAMAANERNENKAR